METYIPDDGATTFLGQGTTGEVDGIQAFKREQRQKERRDALADNSTISLAEPMKPAQESSMNNSSENQLDEIQLFKLMMKREEERKGSESMPLETPSDPNMANKPSAVVSSESAILAGFGAIRPPKPESPALMNPRTFIQSGSPLSRIQSTEPRPPIPSSAEAVGSRFFPSMLADQTSNPPAARAPNADAQGNLPVGSRLLALGSRPSQTSITPLPAPQRPTSRSPAPLQNPSMHPNKLSGQRTPDLGFTNTIVHGDPGILPSLSPSISGGIQAMRSGSGPVNMDRSAFLQSDPRQMHGLGGSPHDPASSLGGTAAKGSRFAKFFDEKAREAQVSVNQQEQLLGGAPIALRQRQDIGGNGIHADARAMEDIFAMLSQSAQQGTRLHPTQDTFIPDARYFKGHANGSMVSQQTTPSFQGNHSRLDSLYDSRMDDKNFVPDGLVPGLRTAPPRPRQNSAVYSDMIEDAAQLNVQRGPHQQRLLEQMYANSNPSMYGHQHNVGRGTNALLQQQAQLRGGPSPNGLPNDGQRLPPGLANLGGRPPHDGNFVPQHMLAGGNMNGPLQNNPSPLPYGNFPPNGNNFGGQMRAPHPGHQLPNIPHNQAQLHGLANNSNMSAALRGTGGVGQQTHQGPGPMLGMRQQPQQQIPPHMLSQMLPPHLQHQAMAVSNNQPAHDLMALLMGGNRRE
ncbi:hypothetical protein CONPUDRAFT_161288 [Coniophora puteana RWD-64-598 SS2]|uniref:Uncharacterized protein n=1 Tax=Coniophora puteana (strain RWD-64-598) TaxID=741705 RepID=A0A5M3N5I3_CONPW|nr:uncharacterized protein CONPUDRAFT_161288 [Coniophora puteana RWD-64-598 SS2]EIW86566.1 hypothetical protein CONPUDRAFT_161288 [Coniophora puteana RWD-64-598 SS2]